MTTYYVDYENGDDTNNGLGPDWNDGVNEPFKYIPKTNLTTSNAATAASNLTGGDIVSLARGSVWPDCTRIGVTNVTTTTPYNPIIYQAHDRPGETNEPDPIVESYKHLVTGDWEAADDPTHPNVWGTTTTIDGPVYRIFINGIGQGIAEDLDSVDATRTWWHDDNADVLYVWSGSTSLNPSEVYDQVTTQISDNTQRAWGVYCISSSNIIFRDIEFHGGYLAGATFSNNTASASMNGNQIINCTFRYSISGITATGNETAEQQTNLLIQGCKIYIDWNELENKTDEYKGGNAISFFGDLNGAIIEDCIIRDSGFSGISLQNTTEFKVENIIVRNNYITVPVSSYCRPINLAGNNSKLRNIYIYNNYIYNVNAASYLGGENIVFANNIIDTVRHCTLTNYTNHDQGVQIRTYISNDVNNITFCNNIIYKTYLECINFGDNTGSSLDSLNIYNNILYKGSVDKNNDICLRYSEIEGPTGDINISNNICYSEVAGVDTVNWDGTAYTIAEAEAALTQMHDNIALDPLFVNPIFTDGFRISGFSPAIGAGIKPPYITDYNGDNKFSLSSYDIGAIWFNGESDSSEEPRILASGGIR